MFHNRTHSFTRAVIIAAGLLSLAVATADTGAAPRTAAQAQQTPASPDAELVARIRKAITDDKALRGAVQGAEGIIHLAARCCGSLAEAGRRSWSQASSSDRNA